MWPLCRRATEQETRDSRLGKARLAADALQANDKPATCAVLVHGAKLGPDGTLSKSSPVILAGLRRYDATMLRCYDATMLRCYDATMLRRQARHPRGAASSSALTSLWA